MLSISFLGIKENLRENLEKLDAMNFSYFHCDIMDGEFVLNKTWKVEELYPIVKGLHHPLEVHLMVNEVESYVEAFALLHPETIIFHVEATKDPKKMIEKIKAYGCKVGISLKPNTGIEEVFPYLREVDQVLVMSVEPGYGGQKFLPSALEKIRTLKELKKKKEYSYVISVDGGIQEETKELCEDAGCDQYVVGSFITKGDYQKQIDLLEKGSNSMAKKKKRKVNYKRVGILIFIILIFVVAVCIFMKKPSKKEEPEPVKTIDTLEKYGYTLNDNATDYYKELFNTLKEELNKEESSEEEYAKLVSSLFVTDFFTLNNKVTKNDVGGVQFVYEDYKEDFIKFAKEGIYHSVESNIYKDRKQVLPVVTNVEVVSIEQKDSSYEVHVKMTYEKDLGYQEEAILTLVHNEEELEIIKMEEA